MNTMIEPLELSKERLYEIIADKIKYYNASFYNVSIYWNKNRTKVFTKIYVAGKLHKTIQGYIRENNNIVVITEKYTD